MIIEGMNFTIGADPELFIGKKGKPLSAHGLIPGNKKEPFKVERGAVQVDGLALEFNIDPANNKDEFKANLNGVKDIILGMVKGYDLIDEQTVVFDLDHYNAQPREALRLGCEADYCASNGRINPRPIPNRHTPSMRTVGGHVHIGWDNEEPSLSDVHFARCCQLTRYMDEEVGVYSILWDKDDLRREMYGKASAFRPKNYGVEYRSMSNKWVLNDKLIEIVYDFTIDAIKRMFVNDGYNHTIPGVINNSRRDHLFFKNNPKADRVLEAVGG